MNKETFEKYKNSLLRKAATVRARKEEEYFSTEDSLGNFRTIAAFRHTSTPVSIMDLGAKSIVSISDMVNYNFSGLGPNQLPLPEEATTVEEWDGKFVDAVNYLLKLYASIREETDAK